MTALAQALYRTYARQIDVQSLWSVAMFCAAGLFASMLYASYGIDLSPGFF